MTKREEADDPKAEPDGLSGAELAETMARACRRLHVLGYEGRLFPAQWTALRYLDTAEPERRTAADLARFQGIAAGAVARTVRTLIEKDCLKKAGTMIGRGRAERLDLTPKGRQLLRKDPLARLARAYAEMSEEERLALAQALERTRRAIGGNW